MKYYPDVDVLVVELREGRVVDEELLEDDVVVSYDEEGRAVRIEIHEASTKGLMEVAQGLLKTAVARSAEHARLHAP